VEDGYDGLANRTGHDRQFWNRIPDQERRRVVEIALASPELSPREVAFKVTDTEGWFISESSVYRILKAHDLITSPAYRVLSAADEYHGRHEEILSERQRLKAQTLRRRACQNRGEPLGEEELIRPSTIRECVH